MPFCEESLSLDLFKDRLLQEEQRFAVRKSSSLGDSVSLYSKKGRRCRRNPQECTYCSRKGNKVELCWKKYPQPHSSDQNTETNQSENEQAALIHSEVIETNVNDEFVCLFSNTSVSSAVSSSTLLSSFFFGFECNLDQ